MAIHHFEIFVTIFYKKYPEMPIANALSIDSTLLIGKNIIKLGIKVLTKQNCGRYAKANNFDKYIKKC